MSDQRCDEFRPKLVAFADGELDEAGRSLVARHLDGCAACRQEAERLDRSLAAAREVWRQAADRAEAAAGTGRPTRATSRVRRLLAASLAVLAAVVALAAGVALWPRPAERQVAEGLVPPAVPPNPEPGASPARAAPQADDPAIDDYLARVSRAARLAAAADMLAAEPSLRDEHRRAERYFRSTYADALGASRPAGHQPLPSNKEPKS